MRATSRLGAQGSTHRLQQRRAGQDMVVHAAVTLGRRQWEDSEFKASVNYTVKNLYLKKCVCVYFLL